MNDESWIRKYLFEEAMAIYELYYSPLSESMEKPGMDAQPLTWVPVVFHATSFENFGKIIESGNLDPDQTSTKCISLTEFSLGDIDRLQGKKIKSEVGKSENADIAIGFPRKVLEEIGFANPIYLKHFPSLKDQPDSLDKLGPFIEKDDDLGAFQEIRTLSKIPIKYACWILSRHLDDNNEPKIDGIDEFIKKYGPISISYWHRTHQLGILKEWQYLKLRKEDNKILNFETIGEYYYKKKFYSKKKYKVRFPAGKSHELFFDEKSETDFEGPYRFIDILKLLNQNIPNENVRSEIKKYSLIEFENFA